MCNAEDDLRRVEGEIERQAAKVERLVDLIDDVARGVFTPDEAQREAHRIAGAVYAA